MGIRFDRDRVRKRRHELGLTQNDIAARSGYRGSTVWRAEKGVSISEAAALCIAKTLEAPITQLTLAGEAHLAAAKALLNELLSGRMLTTWFQPLRSADGAALRGYEALARTVEAGFATPKEMFQAARRLNQEVALSKRCRVIAVTLAADLRSTSPLFLNVCSKESLRKDVLGQLEELRRICPTQPFVFELNERARKSLGALRKFQQALIPYNATLAFDDFGVGESRIEEVLHSPPKYLKFDIRFIHRLTELTSEQFQRYERFIHERKEDGVITVAEGVESPDLAKLCERIGFDLLQGYEVGRPADINSLRRVAAT